MLTRARKRLVAGLVALVAVSGATLVAAPPASAANGCNVEYVRSNAMNRTVPVCIVSAGGGGPKPTLYLLDGLRAPEQQQRLADQHQRRPLDGGQGHQRRDPVRRRRQLLHRLAVGRPPALGVQKWETFLTRELPGYMAARHGSDNRRNGIAGLSMSGTSALNLASRHPGFYKAVASYSGYPTVTMPGFTQGIMASVARWAATRSTCGGASTPRVPGSRTTRS